MGVTVRQESPAGEADLSSQASAESGHELCRPAGPEGEDFEPIGTDRRVRGAAPAGVEMRLRAAWGSI